MTALTSLIKTKNNRSLSPKLLNQLKLTKGYFVSTHFQIFPMIITYSAKGYSKLLNTYSNHLASSKQMRDDFLNGIENLINEKFNGSIKKHFLMSLTVAQKI
jgi:hypothetical protein